MAGRSLIFVLFLLVRLNSARREVCYEEHLVGGRKGCEIVQGDFVFNQTFQCRDMMRKTHTLLGYLHFDNSDNIQDPMECVPNLRLINTNTPEYALKVGSNVTGMTGFSWNTSLVIYNAQEKLLSIENDFVVSAELYNNLSSRFKPDRVNILNKQMNGECYFNGTPITFLTDLDRCEIVVGNLVLDSTLQSTETTTPLFEIRGCIIIKNSPVDYNSLLFLAKIRKVRCPNIAVIENNEKLCVPSDFARRVAETHKYLNAAEKQNLIKNMLEKNGQSSFCDGVCYAAELEAEDPNKVCTTVKGDIYLKASIVSKLVHMSKLEGRLIVDGYGGTDVFKVLPKLTTISDSSRDPLVVVSHNFKLHTLKFPKNLKMNSKADVYIKVKDNFFFRMDKKQYDELLEKYGKERLEIDYLEEGECYFGTPIKNITQIDKCKTIYGNLDLNGNVGNQTAGRPKLITGCIWIKGTNLTDIPFISKIGPTSGQNCTLGHQLRDNKQLCTDPWIGKIKHMNFHRGDRRLVVVNNKPHCPKTCARHHMKGGPDCVLLSEGFSMPLEKEKIEVLLPSMINIEKMMGALRIRRTNATRLDVFNSLNTILMGSEDPAVDITDNKYLETLDFPSLNKIESPLKNGTIIRIRNNGKFKLSVKQYKILAEKFGQDRLDVDHEVDPSFETGVVIGVAIVAVFAVCAVVAVLGVGVGKTVKRIKGESKPLLEKEKKDRKEKKLEDETENNKATNDMKAEEIPNLAKTPAKSVAGTNTAAVTAPLMGANTVAVTAPLMQQSIINKSKK